MAEVDEKVMTFVEETLQKRPKIQLEELFEKAKKVSGAVKDLSKRQFNARYPLQVKRRRSQASRGKGARRKGTGGSSRGARVARGKQGTVGPRESVRQVFLQFATDITGAEDRKDLVRVLASVDAYVDQVLKGVARL
ncbi:MAG: hypothetical protein PVJ04_02455 [Gemmatimonadota bacterium]